MKKEDQPTAALEWERVGEKTIPDVCLHRTVTRTCNDVDCTVS